MQVWLFLFGAVVYVALSEATPGGNEKPVVGKESLHHHLIRKRQLEAVNSLSGLRKCVKYNNYCYDINIIKDKVWQFANA